MFFFMIAGSEQFVDMMSLNLFRLYCKLFNYSFKEIFVVMKKHEMNKYGQVYLAGRINDSYKKTLWVYRDRIYQAVCKLE